MKRFYAGKSALFKRYAVFASICALGAVFGLTRVIAVQPAQSPAQATLAGKGWAYTVPFAVKNVADIEALVSCESQGVNIARPDSNGLISWGIGQFNGTSTWAAFSKASGISPEVH